MGDDVCIFRVVGEVDQRAVRFHSLAGVSAFAKQSRVRAQQKRFHEVSAEQAGGVDETFVIELVCET